MRCSSILATLAGLAITSSALPVAKSPKVPMIKRDISGPVIDSDFPDPCIIQVDGTWYAFGTQSIHDNTNIKTQLATSDDFQTWTLQPNYDALRNLPSWVNTNNPQIWAPDVFQVDDGSYIMYFSAATAANTNMHCVGAAKSSTIEGPYDSVSNTPLACPTQYGGAIDASHFTDFDGSRYMVYKDDGNSIGHGGTCNNMVEPQVDTWIVLIPMASDGVTQNGDPTRLINRDNADGPLVEAPVISRTDNGQYVLYFSSQCYTDDNYDTSYAVSSSLKGGYQKARYPLLVTGTTNVWGPGGAGVADDGVHMAFHGYQTQESNTRSMYVATTTFHEDSNTVTVV